MCTLFLPTEHFNNSANRLPGGKNADSRSLGAISNFIIGKSYKKKKQLLILSAVIVIYLNKNYSVVSKDRINIFNIALPPYPSADEPYLYTCLSRFDHEDAQITIKCCLWPVYNF